jgi:uncharacterized protein YcbK (DUF882 family)
MIIKKGVDITRIDPVMGVVFKELENIQDNGVCIVITSAYRTEEFNKLIGGHPKSKHLKGRAIDISKQYLVGHTDVVNALRQKLNPVGFDVVNEDTHVHIEYDPK